MNFYNYIYRPIQNFISILLKKKNFIIQISNFLNKKKYKEIHEIGCSEGILVPFLNLKETNYFGYDIDQVNINRAKKKFKNYKNIKFYKQSIDNILIKNKNKKKIFLLIGVFHHLSDYQILRFLKKLSLKDHVIAIDPFFHKKQNIVGYLMKKMDRGQYIRTYNGYKKILSQFIFKKKISYYLRFYSHLLSIKNINKQYIKIYFN